MSTSYTAAIKDGITFEQFAMTCATAFGGGFENADLQNGKWPTANIEPSTYHLERLKDAQNKLAKLEAMSDEDSQKAAEDYWIEQEVARKLSLNNVLGLKEKYNAMYKQVKAWTPPNQDLKGLKDFMITQISDSIEFDCSSIDSLKKQYERMTGEAYRTQRIAELRWSIEHHQRNYEKDVERAANKTKWIMALRDCFVTGESK